MSKRKTTHRKPFWQTRPCPAWCSGLHDDRDKPEVRVHQLEDEPCVVLSTHKTVPYRHSTETTPVRVHIGIQQGYRETEPLVTLYQGLGSDEEKVDLQLTLAETEKLIRHLTKILRKAGQPSR